jgi:hypothetical protein
MNQTDSGWRKRQIALEKMAENARELGLDYEPSIIKHDVTVTLTLEDIELYDRARAINLPTIVVSMYGDRIKMLIAEEREACSKLAEKLTWADNMGVASAIRARGQA